MTTVNPTQPLGQINPRSSQPASLAHAAPAVPSLVAFRQTLRSCHQLGICQNPNHPCSEGDGCQLARPIAMPKPAPLPTLAPGLLTGPYRAANHAQICRQRRSIALFWALNLAVVLATVWMIADLL